MQNLRRNQQAWWAAVLLAGAVSAGPFASGARAQTNVNMTEHGFCGASAGPSSPCQDNGTITPIGGNTLLEFGFTRSPDNNSGLTGTISFDLVALVPTTAPGAGTQVITETSSQTSIHTGTLALQLGVFNSGMLDSFLGLTRVGGPANPIGGFLAGETNQGITGVTGFDVYLFDYGSVTFGSSTPGSSTGDPIFDNSGTFSGMFPTGTELYSFIDGPGAGQRQDATAISSTIILAGASVPVPDGGMTLVLLGGALVGLATLRQRFRG